MNLSEQAVYLGTARYKRTVWNLRRKDGRLLGAVRFKGMPTQMVAFVGNESDLTLQGTVGNRGHWEIVHRPEAKPAAPKTGTGVLKGRPVADIITQFFGTLAQWPIERDAAGNWSQSDVQAIAEHMARTGDCLWHAQSIVMNWPTCHCAGCGGGATKTTTVVQA